MTHAPETGTENLYQKTGTIFRTEFFSVPDETGSKISGLFFSILLSLQFILKR